MRSIAMRPKKVPIRCIANIPMTHNAAIHAVVRAGEGKDRSFHKIMGNFPVILLNDLSFPSPNDVIRPRPFRPSTYRYDVVACRDVASDDAKKLLR